MMTTVYSVDGASCHQKAEFEVCDKIRKNVKKPWISAVVKVLGDSQVKCVLTQKKRHFCAHSRFHHPFLDELLLYYTQYFKP